MSKINKEIPNRSTTSSAILLFCCATEKDNTDGHRYTVCCFEWIYTITQLIRSSWNYECVQCKRWYRCEVGKYSLIFIGLGVVAHRISNIRDSDMICVFNNGAILELGDLFSFIAIQKNTAYYFTLSFQFSLAFIIFIEG